MNQVSKLNIYSKFQSLTVTKNSKLNYHEIVFKLDNNWFINYSDIEQTVQKVNIKKME